MAVSQAQIVDLLYKQAFGVTKTDTATNKSPSNENIPSPLLLRGDTLWTQADQIPGVAADTAGIVQAYTGVNAIECTADNTTVPIGGIYPTWLTSLTYWIPSEFGSTYTAQVWIDNPGASDPTATGTQIFAAGSGGTGQYYYNYQSGVLNFIGETIPAGLTAGKVLYIVGYRYIGLTGVTNLPSGTSVGNISITGSTISSKSGSNANITITPDGTGVVVFTKNITSTANISAGNMSLTGSANISGNISANYISGNGSGLTGVTASSSDKLANGNSTVNVLANGNITFSIANTANSNVAIPNVVVVSSNGVNVSGYITTTGNITAPYFIGNVSGNISGNITITGPNTGIVFNDDGSANSTIGFIFDKTSNTANISNTFNVGNLLTVGGAANITGNILLGTLAENQINSSGGQLTINGGFGNTSGQLSLFAGVAGDSAKISLSAVSNSIASEADSFTFYNRANSFTLVTISNTSTVSTSTSTGALVANGGVGVSGNLFVGGFIDATSNVTTGALISPTLTSNTTTLTLSSANTGGDNNVILVPTGANGAVSVSSKKIVNLATPTQDTDAATKAYVDSVAQGLDPKASVVYATAAVLPAYTYNNGTSGVGATITGNAVGALSIDGSAVSANERVLIKNETSTNAPYNGIYVVTTAGSGGAAYVLTRTADFDSASPSGEIPGAFVFVEYGTTNADTGWVCTTNAPVTVGTTDIVFVQFSGAGSYSANTSAGLVLIGSQFNAKVDGNANPTTGFDANGNIYVPASAWFTTPNIGAATGTSLTVTANVVANVLTANLTLDVTGNANVGNLGTAGLIIATGNISGGNINTGGQVVATGNGTFGNISTTGSGGNITGANVVSANTFSGNLVATTGNVTGNLITSNLTVNLEFSGNTANFTGNLIAANLRSNALTNTYVTFAGTNGVLTDNANLTFSGTELGITGTANVSGTVKGGNLQSTELTANYVTYAGANGLLVNNANFTFSGGNLLTVTGSANITGNLAVGNISSTGTFDVTTLDIGNTSVTASTVTTNSVGPNISIASYPLTGSPVTGIEFLVKGHDITANTKYSVATVLAVTDGTTVDYTVYGTVRIGTSTGTLLVNVVSSNVELQVTPSSSNNTVWTTQIRTI